MKKLLCLIEILSMLLSFTGCFSSVSQEANPGSKNVSESEAIKHVENTVVEALEEKDADKLKSIFSEKALSRANDFDIGMEYVFDLYQGNFIEITDENHCVDEYFGEGKRKKVISAWCIIKTDVGMYIVSWVDAVVQEFEPEMLGVYNLEVDIYIENDDRCYYEIAGINYPEREVFHNTLSEISDALENKDVEGFKSLFSSSILCNPDTEEKINELFKKASFFKYSDIGYGWVGLSELKNDIYFEIRINSEKYIMYLRYDLTEKDKISVFKLMDIEDINDCEDETIEPGIYLPF